MSLSNEIKTILTDTVSKLTTDHKGILAADESTGTIGKRLATIGVENTKSNRRRYRKLLFTTPNLETYIGGVIVYEETLYEVDEITVKRLVNQLFDKGILVGIKTDKGSVPLQGEIPAERYTEGLDGLYKRNIQFFQAGARFAKWRCIYHVDGSDLSVIENAHVLARYARLSQLAGLVPIVEPEILIDGSFYSHEMADRLKEVLRCLFVTLIKYNVWLPGIILKTNFAVHGKSIISDYSDPQHVSDVVTDTLDVIRECVPNNIGGIFFLSGGLNETDATTILAELNRQATKEPYLSFSYGRALQRSCLDVWQGCDDNNEQAQQALLARCEANRNAVASRQ